MSVDTGSVNEGGEVEMVVFPCCHSILLSATYPYEKYDLFMTFHTGHEAFCHMRTPNRDSAVQMLFIMLYGIVPRYISILIYRIQVTTHNTKPYIPTYYIICIR